MPETLILRPQIDIGSNILLLLGDVHAAACGIEIEGLRPFDASRGFVYSLALPALPGAFFSCRLDGFPLPVLQCHGWNLFPKGQE